MLWKNKGTWMCRWKETKRVYFERWSKLVNKGNWNDNALVHHGHKRGAQCGHSQHPWCLHAGWQGGFSAHDAGRKQIAVLLVKINLKLCRKYPLTYNGKLVMYMQVKHIQQKASDVHAGKESDIRYSPGHVTILEETVKESERMGSWIQPIWLVYCK